MKTTSVLYYFGYVWPEPVSSAAGVRTLSLLKSLRKRHKIIFFSPSQKNRFSEALESDGIECMRADPNDSACEEFLKKHEPAVSVFDRFVMEEQFGWRIRELFPDCLRVIDTQDLHFLRKEREGAPAPDALLRELASVYRSDLSLVISRFEYDLLQSKYGVAPSLLHYCPFFVPEIAAPSANFSGRRHFVFLGNFRHPPNYEAALHLHDSLWPKLSTLLPAAELHLYGAYPPKEITSLHSPPARFYVNGPCEDAVSTLQAFRVNLAPLRFGAGLKGKIVDGWMAGTPCVSTAIGAEGMGETENWGGLVADTDDALVAACGRLHENETLWREKSERGRSLLKELFDGERESLRLQAAIEEAQGHLRHRREENLTGRMLWHQTMRSTRYFSRWIEAKNKNA